MVSFVTQRLMKSKDRCYKDTFHLHGQVYPKLEYGMDFLKRFILNHWKVFNNLGEFLVGIGLWWSWTRWPVTLLSVFRFGKYDFSKANKMYLLKMIFQCRFFWGYALRFVFTVKGDRFVTKTLIILNLLYFIFTVTYFLLCTQRNVIYTF